MVASADMFPRRLEACWVASHGSPVADSARIAAALINSFALLLVLASWAAWGGPAIIEVWLEMEYDLNN